MGFLQSDLFSQISWSRRANPAVLGDLFSILISVRIHILDDIQIIKYLCADCLFNADYQNQLSVLGS